MTLQARWGWSHGQPDQTMVYNNNINGNFCAWIFIDTMINFVELVCIETKGSDVNVRKFEQTWLLHAKYL